MGFTILWSRPISALDLVRHNVSNEIIGSTGNRNIEKRHNEAFVQYLEFVEYLNLLQTEFTTISDHTT